MIIKNSEIARTEKLPLCQDCGTAYIDIEIGPDICIIDENGTKFRAGSKGAGSSTQNGRGPGNNFIVESINEAVSTAYARYYLRKSIVADPLYERKNTQDNLPAMINFSFSEKPGLGLEVNLKGGGSENCSWLLMLNPSSQEEDILGKVLELIKLHATKACPPVIIGIGIGSTASEVPKLARKAAFRDLRIRNSDKRYALLENKILDAANNTGIGPQGAGGKTTALACNIEFAPCHMATLPFSVFFGCHSTRRAGVVL